MVPKQKSGRDYIRTRFPLQTEAAGKFREDPWRDRAYCYFHPGHVATWFEELNPESQKIWEKLANSHPDMGTRR